MSPGQPTRAPKSPPGESNSGWRTGPAGGARQIPGSGPAVWWRGEGGKKAGKVRGDGETCILSRYLGSQGVLSSRQCGDPGRGGLMINWLSGRPAVPLPAPLEARGVEAWGRECHSCSIARSRASPPPPYLPAPRGSPRLPAVGSGAGGEMEDALGREQGFKGPASSWVPLAQQGAAGAEWDGEPKSCSLSPAPHLTLTLRWAAGGSGGGWVGKNEIGKRKEGGLLEAR